jgi:hypothetical protein
MANPNVQQKVFLWEIWVDLYVRNVCKKNSLLLSSYSLRYDQHCFSNVSTSIYPRFLISKPYSGTLEFVKHSRFSMMSLLVGGGGRPFLFTWQSLWPLAAVWRAYAQVTGLSRSHRPPHHLPQISYKYIIQLKATKAVFRIRIQEV